MSRSTRALFSGIGNLEGHLIIILRFKKVEIYF